MAVMSVRLTEVSIGSEGVLGTDRMTVNPLSLGGVAAEPEHLKDLPAVNVGVTILRQATFEPTDSGRASDGVEAESPDGAGVVAVDGVTHRVVVVVVILQGRPAQSRSEMCHLANCPLGRVASHFANHC